MEVKLAQKQYDNNTGEPTGVTIVLTALYDEDSVDPYWYIKSREFIASYVFARSDYTRERKVDDVVLDGDGSRNEYYRFIPSQRADPAIGGYVTHNVNERALGALVNITPERTRASS